MKWKIFLKLFFIWMKTEIYVFNSSSFMPLHNFKKYYRIAIFKVKIIYFLKHFLKDLFEKI